MSHDEDRISELALQAASATECTGLVPALMEAEEESDVRSLYAVDPAKRPGRMPGK